jgi:hypothetical protein
MAVPTPKLDSSRRQLARFSGEAFGHVVEQCPEAAAGRSESQRLNLRNFAEAQLGLCAGSNHSDASLRIGAPSRRGATAPTLCLFSLTVQRRSDLSIWIAQAARRHQTDID